MVIAPEQLVRVRDLTVYFAQRRQGPLGSGHVRAVDGIDLDISSGETLGLVGESGCGKSTTGRAIVGLQAATSGSIEFGGIEISKLSRSEMRPIRRRMQMVFQDPYASLNPRRTVEQIVGEPLRIHHITHDRAATAERVGTLLEMVGLRPNLRHRYPHEFSGGQRQRIGIARALAVGPEFVVADEATSALDVSVRAQVINLLMDLQVQLSLTYLFIAHDLSVVRQVSDRIAVMYLGKVVEVGKRDAVFQRPRHPYTKALLSAIPLPDPTTNRDQGRIILGGEIPSPTSPPSGCRFRTRCWKAASVCAEVEPLLRDDGTGQMVACHFPEGAPPTAQADGAKDDPERGGPRGDAGRLRPRVDPPPLRPHKRG
jgi:peptide/nickel transport system ATP-binding protein/oligopeptide transport system ATP-binding protein